MNHCPTWNRLPRSERVALVGVLVVAFGTLAFFSFLSTDEILTLMLRKVGLAALLMVLGLTLWGVGGLVLDWWRGNADHGTLPFWRARLGPILVWMACTYVAAGVYPKANRVQMDESVILATSKSIHEEKEPVTPTMFRVYSGIRKLDLAYVDKRPFFFAAIVAFLHDLRGYSVENPFYCNMALGGVVLAMLGLVGARLGGRPMAGVVAMIAMAAVPVFCEHATGGGIDVLNLAMVLLVMLLGMRHLDRPSLGSGRALLGAAILLAYSRYESLLYAAALLVVLWAVFLRKGRFYFDWSTPALIAGLLPLAGIHFLTFSRAQLFFQLEEKGASDAFSLSYVPSNLAHALSFFLDGEHMRSNSPWVFVIGVLAMVAVCVSQAKRWREILSCGYELAFWSVAGVTMLTFLLLMAYSWGQLDEPVGSRLSLPLYLLLALSIAFLCREIPQWPRFPAVLAAALAFACYWSVFPLAAKQYGRFLYVDGRTLEYLDDFNKRQPDRRFMVLSGVTNFWLTRDVYAVAPRSIGSNPVFLSQLIKSQEFRRIYLIQVANRDSEDKPYKFKEIDELSLELDTTLVSEDLVIYGRRVRISLVNPSSTALLDREAAKLAAKVEPVKPALPEAGVLHAPP